MDTNHNRIKVADLEKNERNKILTTDNNGELKFSDINDIKIDSYNSLDYTTPGKALDARQGKVLKDLIDNDNANVLHKTGDESWSGIKSTSNSGGFTNALQLENNSTFSTVLAITNNSTGFGTSITNYNTGYGAYINNIGGGLGMYVNNANSTTAYGVRIDNQGTGSGIGLFNSFTGRAIDILNSNTGTAIRLDSSSSSTGDLLSITKNSVPITRIDSNGIITTSTPTSTDNSSKVATTAFVKAITLQGSGNANFLPKWTSSNAFANSVAQEINGNIALPAGSGLAYSYDTNRMITPEDGTFGALIKSSPGGGFRVFQGTTERMQIDTSGRLGLGTAAPNAKLTVRVATSSGFNATDGITINDLDTNPNSLNLGVNTASNYGWIQSIHQGFGYEKLLLNPNGGNVGIGTTPSNKLDVKGGLLTVNNENTYAAKFSNYSTKGVVIGFDTNSNIGHIGAVVPSINWATLCLNYNGGTVYIGNIASDSGQKLQVNGTVKANQAVTDNDLTTLGQVKALGRPYKIYTVQLFQTGTLAPRETFVFENTLGSSIAWTRTGIGTYRGACTGRFTLAKTVIFVGSDLISDVIVRTSTSPSDSNYIDVYTNRGITPTDGLLINTTLEIRVYN